MATGHGRVARESPLGAEDGRARGARRRIGVALMVALVAVAGLPLVTATPAAAADNEIVTENLLPGTPASVWDVAGAGSSSIQGFATDISVDQGQTVQFKVDTPSTDYRLDIYRLGYYGGDGARLVDTIQPSAALPQVQPACLEIDGTTNDNLIDCGNWGVSASWSVPPGATSGIYIARATREDVAGDLASHITFIVRDDDGASDLLFQTSDTTWQAYNQYGGYSLYSGPSGHAYKVSYNRPFTTRDTPVEDALFNAEYPMLRWLERNGYDVSYSTGVDTARRGSELLEHQAFLSVGHDEYWSAEQRANVEAARDAGVDLAFFSGNEVYWKTRWEPSTADGGSTNHRTLVSYKEGNAQGSAEHYDCFNNFACDPDPVAWTGLWRQNTAGHDGGRPENSLSGQISWGDSTAAIQVPAAATGLRFWRNTGMSGATTLNAGTLGYEFDWEQPEFASSNPPGRITLSDTTAVGKNHKMSLYRAPSGALVFGAGTVQWSWGLDGTHDRGGSTEDPRMQQATVNLLSDMGAQPASLQAGLVLGGALDSTAPTATITAPTGGATVPGGNVTITGTAADTGGLVAAVEVSTDGGTTWNRATGTTSWTYTFNASNGPVTAQARAIDDAANIGTATSVSFTVAAQVCPCSIFTPATTGVQENDPAAVELGVKFRSDVAGSITGIRFYKTAGNTGAHTGTLWSAAGANLGTVTFSGESATGWQEATFGAPVAIAANTTYVASYHTTGGNYATGTSFATAGVDNPPLHALQDGTDGPNGVYRYGAGGVFPTSTSGSSNYLVDVVFVDQVVPDTTPPTITGRSPAPAASAVAVGTDVTATFNEPMAAGSINGTTVELRGPSAALVTATVTYNAGTRTVTLNPDSALAYSTTYTATVKGGPSGVTDAAIPANPLAADVNWTFTTAAPPPPPPDEGPGGPILVVSATANPFSRYYVEILRNEGLNTFNAADISTVTPAILADYDVVILGDIAIDPAQATMFETWVTGGGNLIAMRPDPDLASLVGLTDTGTNLQDAYLDIDNSAGKPGTGLVGETIQFHGDADRYSPNVGTEVLATLYATASTATTNPAVTVRSVGTQGGQAAAFTYDLARSVVETRQGNPAWAGQERDGELPPILRSDDMFYPDWIDFTKVEIPQADEQQRLLANLIQHVNRDQMPLPRFWYFPRGEKAVVVMTGDDHASNGTAGQFDWASSVSPTGCSVADWECVRQTSYMYPNTPLSDAAAAAYEAQGFEVGVHVNTNCADWTPTSLEGFYDTQLSAFGSAFPSVPAPSTHRTHCIAWSDWATQPQVEAARGIRLDTNYYYWPAAWVQDRPGYFTGSGLPMRFADLDGSMIDAYQAATQMPDESGLNYSLHINTLLDNAIGAEGYYGVVTTNMHTDTGRGTPHPGQVTVVNAALAKGVPVVSARQMLTWLDGRNGSSFEDLALSGNNLTFSIARGAGSNGLQAMLPTQGANGTLQTLTRGGSAVAFSTQTIKGIQYATFDAAAGAYSATYAADTTAPTISSLAAVPGADGTATVTWTTDEPATSRVDYGTSPGSLTSFVSDGNLTTSHSVQLTGLSLDTTYHFRVTSADAVPNTTISPNPPDAPATFTTPTAVATDTTVAHFSAGTTGSSTYVSDTAGGEVILAPEVGAEFAGTSPPSGWSTGSWTGGSTIIGSGQATVDGSWIRADALGAAGRAVEFVGTFSGASFQNAGFGVTLNGDSGESMALFGVGGTSGVLQARIWTGSFTDVALGAQYIGSQHRFRIEWDTSVVRFYIDGTLVHTATTTLTGTMRPIASDYDTGGGALSVDWMRVSPYAPSGTFLSRIHDAGSPADWGAFSYVADVPGSTSLALSVRTGPTPTPDGSWSSFAPVAQGGDVPTSGRYLQYRVEATTSSAGVTPTLFSVTVPYNATGTATVPDTPTGVSAMPGDTEATVSWTAPTYDGGSPITGYEITAHYGMTALTPVLFSSTATMQTMTGLTNGTSYVFTVRAINAIGSSAPSLASNAVTPATVPGTPTIGTAVAGASEATVSWTAPASNGGSAITGYAVTPYIGAAAQTPVVFSSTETTQTVTGLTIGTTYTFRVAAINAIGTGAQSAASNQVVPFGTATDTTVAHFTAGTTASTYVSDTAGGEVILAPEVGAEFGGTTTPSGWSIGSWTGGSTAIGSGRATVDGSWIRADALGAAGRSVEFVGTFSGAAYQNAGFGVTLNGDPGESMALFGMNGTSGVLQARTYNGSFTDVELGAQYIGSEHRFRIEWDTSAVRFYIDGTLVHTATTTLTGTMRPIASDLNNGGGALSVDWIRVTPYSSPGTFLSRVHDAGSPADWGAFSYVADVPGATSLALSVRTGSTPTPDECWSSFAPVTQGGDVPTSGRHLQYRVEATTSSAGVTPTLSSVTLAYNPTGATTTVPCAPTAVSAVPGNTQAIVSWTTPAYDGGSPITGYEVTPYIGMTAQTPVVFPSTATTQTMTGLTNGTSYVFTVRAINAIGPSAPSLASNAVVPATVPGPPTIGTAVADAFEATVSWTAPASNGGSAITGYAVTPYIGATAQTPYVFNSTVTTQTLTGLTVGTTYTFRVAATNAIGTGAQSAASNSVVPFGEVGDTTRADFAAGTGTGTVLVPVGDGALSLGGPATYDFEGNSLPAGLTATAWTTGGVATMPGADGSVIIDAAVVRTDASYAPGSSVEFVATFGSDPNQHIGFGTDLDTQPWAMFSTFGGGSLYARTNNAGTAVNTPIPGSYLGAPHWYRIEWDASAVRFLIDGELVHTQAATIGTGMQVVASDLLLGGAALPVYHLVVQTPVGSGEFVSRVLDAKITADWGTLTADTVTPPGTAVAFETRTGATSSPDGTWSSWGPVGGGGVIASPTARFVQYRATLTTSDPSVRPQVNSVRLLYTVGGPVVPVIGAAGPQGSWPGVSGAAGYALGAWNTTSDALSLAGPLSGVTVDRGARKVWKSTTSDVRATQSPDRSFRRAAGWYHPNQLKLRVTFDQAFTGNLNLYALDWDSNRRRQVVTVSDGSTSQQSALTTSFRDGAWMAFPVDVAAGGTVTITVDRTAGKNAVLSAITLGGPLP